MINAKKHGKKKIICIIIVTIVVLLFIFVFGGTSMRFPKALREKYRGYYLFSRDPLITISIGENPDIYYFLPGQKAALQRKIKSNMSEEMLSLPDRFPDAVEKVEISEDFRKIYITFYKGKRDDPDFARAYGDKLNHDYRLEMQLYFNLQNDKGSNFFEYIESENVRK